MIAARPFLFDFTAPILSNLRLSLRRFCNFSQNLSLENLNFAKFRLKFCRG
ncbi:hypothetical protein CAMRE0001_2924 [Campylobacter rectus RM3267]|uniref:Uncharacterized protein n=1 Tax=Campylobacter rectus RM3267 TaxID=553218 RepID=B9D282_CAMRE|nr:hypothetical protein CAMRE0001_2924 [Campylobacter rectus RM3267]